MCDCASGSSGNAVLEEAKGAVLEAPIVIAMAVIADQNTRGRRSDLSAATSTAGLKTNLIG